MKKLIFSLTLVALIFIAALNFVPNLIEWTNKGQNDVKNIVLLFGVIVIAKPLAHLIDFLTNLFIPERD